MAKNIVVYHQPGCPPCHSAMEFLKQHGIPFTHKDITEDDAALDELMALGSRSTPTIVVGEDVMIGFRKDELLAMIAK
ncbi:MAG: glutaredoxin family protein [Planctomycetes bacterium]|nr:glutaredoxin family protein [Planctomycetota bacterium]MBL8767544.1 glutaredoxin family protein [Planctomycetota bacterium]MCC7172372.1 glutaredoxin family protein [Planctomycetota bacterium]